MTRRTRQRSAVLACLLAVWFGCAAGCNMRQQLKATLGDSFMPPTPAEAARMAVNMYDADSRRQGVALLSASSFGGEEQYVKMYRLLVDDPDPTVRAVILKALGEHGSVEDALILVRYLNNPNEPAFVRWEAAKGLQRIHNPAATPALITAVRSDPDASVRRAAADALGQYPQPNVLQTLIGALDDENFGVTVAAHRALRTLTGQDFNTDGAQWLRWSEENRGRWFANQQPYTVEPYVRPPGLVERVQFWKKRPEPEPVVPTGLNVTAGKAPET